MVSLFLPAIEHFKIKVCTFLKTYFSYTFNRLQYSNFYMHGETKQMYHLFYCDICFIAVVWNRTHNISEVCQGCFCFLQMNTEKWNFWIIYNCSTFIFFHITYHSGCAHLHSHQQWMRVAFSPYPHQQLLICVFGDSHSDRCEVKLHCGLDLHLSDD